MMTAAADVSSPGGHAVLAAAGLFLALTWSLSLMRLWCRIKVVKKFGVDDALAFVAQIFFTVFCASGLNAVSHGYGRHMWDIPDERYNLPQAMRAWYICEITFVLSLTCFKLSTGMFLMRLAVSRLQHWFLWGTNAVITIISLYFFFLFIFQCQPISSFWTGQDGRKCVSFHILLVSIYVYSSINCATNWAFCILPSMVVWKLQLNKRTKISIIGILSLSTGASIVSLVRVPYMKAMGDDKDFTYKTVNICVLSIIELGVGIIALSIATLRPIFRVFLAKSSSWNESSAHAWPPTVGKSSYMLSSHSRRGPGDDEECALQDNDHGIRTVIFSDAPKQQQQGKLGVFGRKASQTRCNRSDEDFDDLARRNWPSGIHKQAVISSQRD